MKIKIWEIALFVSLIISLFVGSASANGEELSRNLIRLHVVANSDSAEDQSTKLAVRDAVLSRVSVLLEGCTDKNEAERIISENTAEIAKSGAETVSARGENHAVTAKIAREDFPTVEYDTFALPAGRYTSLRVVIGEGAGHNWWCVVFPPLCLEAAENIEKTAGISSETLKIISEDSGEYAVKFKTVELVSKLRAFAESARETELRILEEQALSLIK